MNLILSKEHETSRKLNLAENIGRFNSSGVRILRDHFQSVTCLFEVELT